MELTVIQQHVCPGVKSLRAHKVKHVNGNSVAGTAANDNTPAGTAGVLQWIQPPHP